MRDELDSDIETEQPDLQEVAKSELLTFVASGRTTSKDLDREVAAQAFIKKQADEGRTFQEIADAARSQSAGIQEKINRNLEAASTNQNMDNSQLIATAILQIAPILIGSAMGGKRGRGAGAQAGLAGVNSFNKVISGQNAERKALALKAAERGEKELAANEKKAWDAEKSGLSQAFSRERDEYKRGTSLATASIRARGEVSAAEIQNQAIANPNMGVEQIGLLTAKADSSRAANLLADKLDELDSAGISGGLSFFLKSQFDPESKEARLQSEVRLYTRELLKAANKGASSDPDAAEFVDIVRTDSDVMLKSPRAISLNLRNISQRMDQGLINNVMDFNLARSPGGAQKLIDEAEQRLKVSQKKLGEDFDPDVEAPPMFWKVGDTITRRTP